MHSDAFVPMMDEFENPGFIELCRLGEEPPSHPRPFEFVFSVKLLTAEEFLYGFTQMEVGGC